GQAEHAPEHAIRQRGGRSQAEPTSCTLSGRMQKVGPRHRMCRRVGAAICGRPNCPSNKRPYPPGLHGRGRTRVTEYPMRLVEQQKLRAMYGVGERQFRKYFERAEQRTGVTGEELRRQLE